MPDRPLVDDALLARIEDDVRKRLAGRRHRLAHVLSVADFAAELAWTYGVDLSLARAAGLLHDWDKALSNEEVVAVARALGVDLGVDLDLVQPLLHGITAALTLPERYPELPPEVWRAVRLHTLGSATMEALDMVVFVADGIEPLRPATPGIERVRGLVGEVGIDELYWESFRSGVEYVIRDGRYLYPGTIDVYNSLCLAHGGKAG